MEKYVILGGARLEGEVDISGAKNSAVALIVASVMVKGVCKIENLPNIQDVNYILEILEKFDDCYNELTDINEREIFTYAFTLGAKIVFEILSKP